MNVSIFRMLAIACVIPLLACDSPGAPSQPGELGRGRFVYQCVEDSDVVCANFFHAKAFPEVFAIGGRFSVDFIPKDDDALLPRLEAAAPTVLVQDSGVFVWRSAGKSAMLAMSDDTVIDYIVLQAMPLVEFRLLNELEDALVKVEVGTGEEVRVDAIPQDEFGRPLGGALEYEWAVADPTVVEILTLSELPQIQLRGLAEGRTTMTVRAAGYEQTIPVEVQRRPAERRACDRLDLEWLPC